MAAWLRGCLAAAVLVEIPLATWGGDIRVGFINPAEPTPPEFWHAVSATMQAAAAELGIDVDIRYTGQSREKRMAVAHDFLAENPPLDYLITSNDQNLAGEIIKLADAAHVKLILVNVDLDPKDWAEYGEPRTKYPSWLGSIVADQEGAGYASQRQF